MLHRGWCPASPCERLGRRAITGWEIVERKKILGLKQRCTSSVKHMGRNYLCLNTGTRSSGTLITTQSFIRRRFPIPLDNSSATLSADVTLCASISHCSRTRRFWIFFHSLFTAISLDRCFVTALSEVVLSVKTRNFFPFTSRILLTTNIPSLIAAVSAQAIPPFSDRPR